MIERKKGWTPMILWGFLAAGMLLAAAGWWTRIEENIPRDSTLDSTGSPPGGFGGDNSSLSPEPTQGTGENENPVGLPGLKAGPSIDSDLSEATGTPEQPAVPTQSWSTAEPRLGGSQYGRSPTGMSGAGEEECRWEVTLEDNFASDHLDTSRWDTGYRAGDQEAQYYVEDAFELEDGILRIRAEERQVDDRSYASGIITTQGKFDQQYGRFEVRAKIPAGQGLWPAFWLMPSNGDWPPEIDVFEILGHDTRRVYMTHRWKEESGEHAFETRGFHGPDFSQAFHVFEVEWTPDELIWRVDGVERSRQTRGIPHEPMFLLLNLAVGGEWPGYPDETTPFPSDLEVDHVRAYAWSCPESNADENNGEEEQTE